MNKNRNTPIRIALLSFVLAAGCATSTFGSLTLTNIPPLDGDTANEGRAITEDGRYVVGLSGTRGFLYSVGGLWLSNVVSSDNAQSTIAVGVGYRYVGGQEQLLVRGNTSSGNTDWMWLANDSGATGSPKRRDTSIAIPHTLPAASAMKSSASDTNYSCYRDNNNYLTLDKFWGAWAPSTNAGTMVRASKAVPSTQGAAINGVSANGRAVCYRKNTAGAKQNYIMDFGTGGSGSVFFFNGLDGTTLGTPYAVNADGTVVFGQSPTVSDQVNLYGYKVVNPGAAQTINALPEFPDTGGSISRAVPYGCTAEGSYASGMSYRGMEKAVVWDTSASDPNLWTVLDLTDLAAANGILGGFNGNLRRAYSLGTNAAGDLAVTGLGVAGAGVQAFLMTVPKWVAAIQFPAKQTVIHGATAAFSIKTNGTDLLAWQWYKNGSPIPGATTTSLTYNNVSCAGGQAGDYQVLVTNTALAAFVYGPVATLTVLDPNISSQPSSRTNLANTTAIFTVSADSSGGPASLSYQWQRGGFPLSDGDTGWGSTIIGTSTASLTISNLTVSDAGSYNVVVTTAAGGCTATSRTATLKVVERPVLSAITLSGGNYTLGLSGPLGQTYIVRYSTNLALPLSSWTPLVTNTFSGWDSFTDSAPPDQRRFYLLDSPYVLTAP